MFKHNIKRQIVVAGIAFALIALLFGMWSRHNLNADAAQSKTPPQLQNGTLFPTPRQIKPFQLKDASNGAPFTNKQLKQNWSLLYFGFTNCATLCPQTLSTLNQVYKNLIEAHASDLPQVIFISIDPERDSLPRIKQYVSSFNKNFKGISGTEKQLDAMTKEFNILYSKENPNHAKDYQIDHSGVVLLIDPQGNLAGLFSPPLDAQTLTKDFQTVVNYAGSAYQ